MPQLTLYSKCTKLLIPIFLLSLPFRLSAEVLFLEDFDATPDWSSQASQDVGPLPSGWDFGYTGETWHPSNTAGSEPSIKITGNNAEQVYGGSGKAFIASYESTESGNYTSDGFLSKDIPGSTEVYVKFNLKFQPGFATDDADGSIKLLRILSYDGVGSRSQFFGDGNSAPIYLFDWAANSYGARHKHAFRCDDQENNYFCVNPEIIGAPASVKRGDMSTNFTSHLDELTPLIPDLVNGGFLPYEGIVFHNNVYSSVWHEMEFYLKQNSAPGALDGVLRVWLDGQPIIDMKQIPWIGNNGNMSATWNNVSFGGNGKYHWDTSSGGFSPSRERWVAFDNIVVLNELPFDVAASMPPSNIQHTVDYHLVVE